MILQQVGASEFFGSPLVWGIGFFLCLFAFGYLVRWVGKNAAKEEQARQARMDAERVHPDTVSYELDQARSTHAEAAEKLSGTRYLPRKTVEALEADKLKAEQALRHYEKVHELQSRRPSLYRGDR